MDVEVFLTSPVVTEEDVRGRTVIVIDVLRTSSTIAAALHNGARAVIPVANTEDAGRIAASVEYSMVILGGERGGERIEGYQHGNSPLEYTPEIIQGQTLILNTTNGTRSIVNARAAEHVLVASFLNADRVVQHTKELGLDVTIICAGWQNRVALEDTLCAGLILHGLWDRKEPGLVSDAAHIAFTQYEKDQDRLHETLLRCNHAQYLIAHGYEGDVEYCYQINTLPVVPYLEDNRLVLVKDRKKKKVTAV